MAGLNAILAKIYSPLGPVGGDVAGSSRPLPQQSSTDGEKDLFLVGRHWQNRAAGEKGSLAAGAGCRCGSCAACAARAYGSQEKSLSASLTAAGEQEGAGEAAEGTAAGTGPVADEQEQAADNTQAAGITGHSTAKGHDGEPLNLGEVAQLAELKKADTAVRAHEQAHLAAAGGLAKGGASFTYQRGPDGHNYAVGGEVQIDTSKGATPEETVAKMIRVRAAALAPANPSPQDRKVAQSASFTMSEAKLEINVEGRKPEEQQEGAGQGAAAENAEGEAEGTSSGTTTDRRKSAVAARAASRYLSTARGSDVFHLAV
jgi:hypothetical protein